MSFERTYKVIVYLLVVVGMVPLTMSGDVPFPAIIATFIAVAHSWFRDIPLSGAHQRSRAWTIGTFVAALGCVFVGFAFDRWLLAAVFFAMVMVVVRLYQGRSARDVFQLYGLTFITIIAGAVINPTIWFLFAFVGYVVLLVWGLVLLHLQRDLERLEQSSRMEIAPTDTPATNAEIEGADIDRETFDWKTRDLVSGRFLAGTSLLALGVFASSLMFFFFFPRLGAGMFFGQGRNGQSVSGFSDQIQLGGFGLEMKTDRQIIMRVELPDRPNSRGRVLRMRGISFDYYDGKGWKKTASAQRGLAQHANNEWRVVYDFQKNVASDQKLRQKVYVEPILEKHGVVFAEPRIVALSIPNPMVNKFKHRPLRFYQGRSANADVTAHFGRIGRSGKRESRSDGKSQALQYEVVSDTGRPSNRALRTADGPLAGSLKTLYLQTPLTWLQAQERDARRRVGTATGEDLPVAEMMLESAVKSLNEHPFNQVTAEARRLTAENKTVHDKVLAIERHLRRTFTYSLTDNNSPDGPLNDFLFRTQTGHCEYFSSGMVMLLRSIGIPARPANGFYGGAYNPYGNYYAVRQADAHSWVEVYYPGFGWQTFDPTPSSSVLVPPDDGWWASMEAWFDSLRLSWYKWVVEYDLEKQLEFFTNIGKSIRSWFPSADGETPDNSGKGWLEGVKKWAKDPQSWLMVGLPILLLIAWRTRMVPALWAWLKQRRNRRRENEPEGVQAYRRMAQALKRAGYVRRGSETPREWARRLEAGGHEASDSVSYLTAAFEAAKYQERLGLSESERASLEAAVDAVRVARRRS